MSGPRYAPRLVGLAVLLGGSLLAGCGDQDTGGSGNELTVWSLENLAPRMAATERTIARFEEASGVEVELVGVAEAQLPQLIMSAAAAGDLPDVIGALPMGQLWQMHGNELLDTEAATRIVRDLDPGTFNANALDLTTDAGRNLAVPSDAWLQLLVYRQDLLDAAGLDVPDTYQALTAAAQALTTDDRYGISLATDPADPFTQQSFESLAVANDCRLVDDAGDVTLDSDACREVFAVYDALAREFGAPGTQTVDSTRATYFAGDSAMIVWSSFILDELAGLRADALPSCPECEGEFLAERSEIVTALQGPDSAEPAQFGEITSWALTAGSNTGPASDFVEFMLTDGYEDWFGMAPEGKIPVRNGTPEEPERFQTAWRESEFGIDTRKPMNEVFSDDLLTQFLGGVSDMRRWGVTEGHGALVGALNGELPVPRVVSDMTAGGSSPDEAAESAQDAVSEIQISLQ
ncbi:ABC transporter substrate-binding protein [Streptomyces sp. B6B3]|uniref:ABC transporter substrate-binding protein n=1 Tax=Streptomyces sp. B6B3 TaxID=3153570 RepID=UPI00325C3659